MISLTINDRLPEGYFFGELHPEKDVDIAIDRWPYGDDPVEDR